MGGNEEQGRNLPGTHTSPTEDMEDHSASPATCQVLGAHVVAVKFQTKVIKSPSVKDQINSLSLLATHAFYCIFLFLSFVFFLQPFKHVKSILS